MKLDLEVQHHRQPPTKEYKGLTIILRNPSRFDLIARRLLANHAGDIVEQHLATQFMSLANCDVRTLAEYKQDPHHLPNTHCLLLLGESGLLDEFGVGFSLGECRGAVLRKAAPYIVASYLPQDTLDRQDYEGRKNPLAEKCFDFTDDTQPVDEKTNHGRTSRSNQSFWLEFDVKKAARIANTLRAGSSLNQIDASSFQIYPKISLAIDLLMRVKGADLCVDIETDSARNITCLGFMFAGHPVYVVPFTRYDYTPAYRVRELCRFVQSLAVAMRDNVVVAHNASYDLLVLAMGYNIPFGRRVYDTMLAQHRCFPEVEKSLGHCCSLWLDEPYHKNDGVFMPNNVAQEKMLWMYNAKDVATTYAVKKAIDVYAPTQQGLVESIAQTQSQVPAYLTCSLHGMRYSLSALETIRDHNVALIAQYLRVLRILVGHDLLPTSPKQVAKYLFDELGYSPISRGKAGPKADSKSMLQLRLKHPDNAVITLVLACRSLRKELGTLKFLPWKTAERGVEDMEADVFSRLRKSLGNKIKK